MKRKTCIFKNFVMLFMAIGLFTVFIGCDDKNDEVGPLRQEVQALRADLTKEFDSKVAAKTTELQKQLDDTKAKVDKMSTTSGVTEKQLNDAKQEVINATVTKVAFDDYVKSVKSKIENAATTSELNALKSDLGKVESRVSALETLVGSNKAALDNALNALDAKYKTQVDALQASINANKTELVKMLNDYKTANSLEIKALNDKLESLEKKMNIGVVEGLLSSRLTSLAVLPDYVSDKGGALPVIFFSPLQTNCGKLAPAVEVKYVVNPSTVTASDIDTRNLRFRYNDPKVTSKTKQELVAPKAEFVSLKNGILTVRAYVNVDETWAANTSNTENRIDQLMLEVPVAGKDIVVSSDWAKIEYSAKTTEIVKTPRKVSNDKWSDYILVSKAQEAKNLSLTNPTVVEMAYNQPLDMNNVVKSMYSKEWSNGDITIKDGEDFDPAKYGLEFVYDLKDENGNEIVYNIGGNKTNQQEFIEIRGGHMLHTKVYTQNGNRAAIGRTPIVHVILKKKGESCIAKEGFVKINIVEQAIPAVPPVVFPYQGTYTAKCGSPQELYRVETQQMNEEFYHKVNMSKEDFHKNYTFANVNGGVGTIKEEQDPTDKTSYNLVYTLTEAEVWQNAGKEVEKKATYTYGNSVIEVTFKVTIVKPTVTLDVLLDNYWYNKSALVKDGVKNTIVQNVAVPADGDTNPNNATYSNNINNAFESVNNLLNVGSGYTYEYKFDNTPKSQPISGTTVSADGKKLMYGSEVIATIERTSEGDMLRYGTSDKAKELLNKGPQYSRAKVVLIVKNSCSKELNVVVKDLQEKDRFEVIFLRPINVEGVSTKHFIDGVDFGTTGSYIDIKEIAELSDWRNFVTRTDKYNFLPDHQNYYAYYGVKNIKVDIPNIKTEGLTVGGRAVTDVPGTVEIKQTPNNETVGTVTYQYGRLTYHNNGNNLGQEFWLVLPVTVEYKWGQIVNTTVKVKVDPTKNARKRVK